MAFTHYRTKGIFLKKEDRGEADQVFALFTEDFGKVKVLAKAIRKITSKLRSGADVFCFSEIEFIQGKTRKTLTDALLIDKFKNLRNNPQKLKIAHQIADVLDVLLDEGEADFKIWQLLLQTLQALQQGSKVAAEGQQEGQPSSETFACRFWEGCPSADTLLPSAYFFWNLFSLLGYKPQLYNCACCGKKLLPEVLFFVPQEGGVVCWQCFKKKKLSQNAWCEISVSCVKILRVFLKDDLVTVMKLKIQKSDEEELGKISELYILWQKTPPLWGRG